MKKYELTDDSITYMGLKLFRIRALISFNNVKAGDLGGYVEKEENLSHDGDAWIYNDARIFNDARIYNNACISCNARISGNAYIYGDARIFGNARVSDKAHISGNARICGNAYICSNARISGDADYLYLKGLGSENRNTTFFKCVDGHIHVSCGCFSGNLAEFETKVKKTHGDSKYAKEYLACIEVVKIHFKEEKK